MNVSTVISICISVMSFLIGGGAVWKLIDLGRFMGRIEQRLDTLTSRAAEDRKHDAEKFDTLYNTRNDQDRRLVKVETQLELISDAMRELRGVVDKIDHKLDGIIQGGSA